MLIKHYSEVTWDSARWPNFSPQEFSCRHCGEFWYAEEYFDAIQMVRDILGRPVRLFSAHRCWKHNANVGGAPLSEHKKIALDIGIALHNKARLLYALKQAGFSSFGFYGTFIHVDMRPGRRWATEEGRRIWAGLIS